jgi:TldD protein
VGGFDLDLAARLELILRADRAARAFDNRIVQVRAGYSEELRRIMVAASDGAFASDTQPLCRLNVFVIAKDGANTTKGSSGGGGRAGLELFAGSKSPEHLAQEAARGAILQLGAVPAPAGEMQVVLGPGWPGVLLHEAVGHGLEADFNRKGTSAFTGLIGRPVASTKVTVVDNGTMAGRRGSLNQCGRRRLAHPGDRADREWNFEGLPDRQAFVAADGNRQYGVGAARKLPLHSHAAHDQYLHVEWR